MIVNNICWYENLYLVPNRITKILGSQPFWGEGRDLSP